MEGVFLLSSEQGSLSTEALRGPMLTRVTSSARLGVQIIVESQVRRSRYKRVKDEHGS